jgi:hypothetical protein
MNEIGFVVFAGAALALLFAFHLAERQRTAAIRGLAIRSGFHYLGDALPRSLTLSGTPFDLASKVWNVIDGEPRGVRVIAFDCQVGAGKSSWRRTVIAVGSGAGLSLMLSFEMTMDSAGKWAIVYRPKASVDFRIAGLMPLGELESYLNSVAAEAPKTVDAS